MPPSTSASANVGVADVHAPERPSRTGPEQPDAEDEPQQVQQSLIAYFEANVGRKKEERLYTWHGSAKCSEDVVWSYADVARRGQMVCVALRRRWEVADGARVMLVYPPSLDFLAAFFGCQYAGVIAVPYYPPVIPASPMPSAAAKKMLADGLAKVVRIYDSCHPAMLLSTTMCAFAPLPGGMGAPCQRPRWQARGLKLARKKACKVTSCASHAREARLARRRAHDPLTSVPMAQNAPRIDAHGGTKGHRRATLG
jgi:hypothetical protein